MCSQVLLDGTRRYIFTNFQTYWTIFLEEEEDSERKLVFNFLPSQQKKHGFLAKNRQKMGEIFQNFGNR